MPPRSPFTLSKQERLKSRSTIQQLFTSGNSYTIFPYRLVWIVNNEMPNHTQNPLQAAFSVSTRYSKRSNQRNRIKRQMRESYRLQKKTLQDLLTQQQKQLSIMFIFVGKEPLEYDFLYEKMQQSLDKLCYWLQKPPRKNTPS
ncbi:MAG: ribonuclease P protein component [Chitinophagales bacterium]|nr:ribonuclease P protein component [Chitinophagales bacterium]